MNDEAGTLTGDCPECDVALLWGGMAWVPHTDDYHAARRKSLMRIVWRRLLEERLMRAIAQREALRGDVVVWWRVVLPSRVMYCTSQVPGELIDGHPEFRDDMLAQLGRGIRDRAEEEFGVRPHPMQVTYRVFDERSDRYDENLCRFEQAVLDGAVGGRVDDTASGCNARPAPPS